MPTNSYVWKIEIIIQGDLPDSLRVHYDSYDCRHDSDFRKFGKQIGRKALAAFFLIAKAHWVNNIRDWNAYPIVSVRLATP